VHGSDQSLSALGRRLHLTGNGTGRCVDAPNGATANGTRLQLYDCNASAAQRFFVT
jgi:hypothetical protein